MHSLHLASQIKQNFPYEPTIQQEIILGRLADFLTSGQERSCFLLLGFAGTGKTTLLSSLVRTMESMQHRCVLLAPTGRAAKVFSAYSLHPAYTIHRWIYRMDPLSGSFCLAQNSLENTLFIVDEASMVSNDLLSGPQGLSASLLDDLITYVYGSEGCRMILLGDTAQLPPVGQSVSPALSEDVLRGYGLSVWSALLDEVVRQDADSGILYNATLVRSALQTGQVQAIPALRVSGFGDVIRIEGEDLVDALEGCYGRDGLEETIVVTRSNRRANQYNEGIRSRILYRESPLEGGDIIMVARNNYFWTRKVKGLPFLANGEMGRIRRVASLRRLYGCEFQEADIGFQALGEDVEVHANLLLDTLRSESPSLTPSERERLFNEVSLDYPECRSRSQLIQRLRQDPCMNALQVKYAYAVTCHKAQGGQWRNVFLDAGYISDEMLGADFYRWLYTALTRATGCLYLVNYPREYLL